MDFIDTHQHLILRDQIGYAWADAKPALAGRDYTPADYAGLAAGKGVVGTVFMETGVDDADYQTEARVIAGLVGQGEPTMLGQIASCRPEVEADFDDWLAECAGLHVKGFRRILHVVPDEVSQTETFRRNLRKIGAAGHTFDLCFLARQLPIAEALAKACDDQVLVLDHCGNPDIASGAFAPWANSITALAALPHLRVKMSGITVNCIPGTASVALFQPYVDHLIQSFGPDRIVWGGDWPVCDLGTGLPRWIDLSRALLAGLNPTEAQAIASGTARRVYRL